MEVNHSGKRAFTLVELLTVLAVISILGCLLLPAMARTRDRSADAGCVSNYRQMMVGWAMYKDENNDNLMLNNFPPEAGWIDANCVEGAGNQAGNTNRDFYQQCTLAQYLNGHIEVYHCPADTIPSANGPRIRSCSMNGQIAAYKYTSVFNVNPGWLTYYRGSDLTCPGPQNTFVFTDESLATINDGWIQLSLQNPIYPDVPANYHDGGCGFSFADGHAEIHKWLWNGTGTLGLLKLPYRYGYGYPNGSNWGSSPADVDWVWLRDHSSCNHP